MSMAAMWISRVSLGATTADTTKGTASRLGPTRRRNYNVKAGRNNSKASNSNNT